VPVASVCGIGGGAGGAAAVVVRACIGAGRAGAEAPKNRC